MPKRDTNYYLQLIKENHKKYLQQNMITYLEYNGALKNAKLIEQYAKEIDEYRKKQTNFLNKAIEEPSWISQIGHGIVAAFVGIGAGAGIGALTGGSLGSAAGGFFGGVLGLAAFEIWKKENTGAKEKTFEEFQESLKQEGFDNKKYDALAGDLVKLFHYRECILLGLTDENNQNMRKDFQKKFNAQNEQALNIALEVYFLDQLNKLFHEAFDQIYNIHDKEILDEKEHPIRHWFMKAFTTEQPGDRERFTQQMQIQFLNQCADHLRKEMNEPSFLARYPAVTVGIAGLLGGAAAIGLSLLVLGGPITIGIATIGLVASCLTAALAWVSVKYIDKLHYQRDAGNRASIGNAVKQIERESIRLNRAIKNAVTTTKDDLEQLKKYKEEGLKQGFLNFINIFGNKHNVAMGSSAAWIREYAARYRHSKLTEIDLSKEEKEIIQKGEKQTETLRKSVLYLMEHPNKTDKNLTAFIKDTKDYLLQKDHVNFIKNFEIISKIKQQILEMTAGLPKDKLGNLPKDLVEFYTMPIENGGLGGNARELLQAATLAPVIAENTAPNEQHPYHSLLNAATTLSLGLDQDPQRAWILAGDTDYRNMLGLPDTNPEEHVEHQINEENIWDYLNASFDFLYTLNRTGNKATLDTPFDNRDEFVLYRTLLLKQLAQLASADNLSVDTAVKEQIKRFAKDKLHIADPDAIFRNILNQTLFIEQESKGPVIKNKLNVNCSIEALGYMADALRLDLTHADKPQSPAWLIDLQLDEFMDEEKTLFCHQQSKNELVPAANEAYCQKLKTVIRNTKEFIHFIKDKDIIKKSGTLETWLRAVQLSVGETLEQIKIAREPAPKNLPLADAERTLSDFAVVLEQMLNENKKKEKLSAGVVQIENYIEKIKKQPQSAYGFFTDYSVGNKTKAATDLKQALEKLNQGEPVDLAFLANKIYKTAELKALIPDDLELLNTSVQYGVN